VFESNIRNHDNRLENRPIFKQNSVSRLSISEVFNNWLTVDLIKTKIPLLCSGISLGETGLDDR